MGSHEVGQRKAVGSRAQEKGTSVHQSGHRLAREVVVRYNAAAVGIALLCDAEQCAVQFVGGLLNAQELLVLAEDADPSIDVGRTVITMYHSHQRAVGRSNQVDGFVGPGERFLQDNHGEGTGTGRHVARTLANRIGCHHTRACITLWGTEGYARLQMAADIETSSPLGR